MELYTYLIEKSKQQGINKILISTIITNENEEILLLERKKEDILGGLDELPTGNIEKDKIEKSIKNIIKNSTNLDLERIESYINSFDYITQKGERVRQLIFKTKTNNDNIKKDIKYKWIKTNEMINTKVNEEILFSLLIYNFNKQN